MRIVELVASNFKRLRAVEVRPGSGGGLVLITGKNDQGKTSVLDAIWAALGGRRAVPADPVRHGAKKAEVQLSLAGEDGEPGFVIRRTFSKSGGTSLKVSSADGQEQFRTPQQLLDGFLGALTFDPLAFASMKPAEQRDLLLGVVGLQEQIATSYEKEKELRAERAGVNREAKSLKAQIDACPDLPADVPADAPDLQGLLAQAKGAREQEYAWKQANREMGDAQQDFAVAKGELERAEARLALTPEPAAEDFDSQIEEAQRVTALVTERGHQDRLRSALQGHLSKAGGLTGEIDRWEAARQETIEQAEMPLEGLGFDEDSVVFEGVRYDQLGTGKALRVAVAIAMKLNPRLKVLRIDHGEALDAAGLESLRQVAEENGYDIWISKVDDSGTGAIVIEDGVNVERTL